MEQYFYCLLWTLHLILIQLESLLLPCSPVYSCESQHLAAAFLISCRGFSRGQEVQQYRYKKSGA